MAVFFSIHRYYMERKIFQHLLELKSLQIRSTKINEAALVKRAVDDYHNSTCELGYETATSLKKYPYSEYSFRNFELFLYETLKALQKKETYNFQNISEVYDEVKLSNTFKMIFFVIFFSFLLKIFEVTFILLKILNYKHFRTEVMQQV